MNLKNKLILITGGSSGIGFEMVKLMSEKGAKVIVLDIQDPQSTLQDVMFIKTDITKSLEIQKALKEIDGGIDILINNAGIIRRGDIFASTEDDFDSLVSILVKASWLMIKETKNKFRNHPTILQILSAHAIRPTKDPGLYTIFKQTVWNMMENIKRDFPEYKIKLGFPGPVDTPLARYGLEEKDIAEKVKIMHKPEYVAAKLLELLENDSYSKSIFDNVCWDYIFE